MILPDWEVLNPAWALFPWLAALLCAALLCKLSPPESNSGRFTAIDGLRGHLAFGVFLHHGVIWHTFLRTDHWQAPSSAFYNQLGQGSVALFFMITALLFVSKLLDTPAGQSPAWLRLYVSRVLRLSPLYLVAMLALFLLCGQLSAWTLRVPPHELAHALSRWLAFTVVGAPDINDINNTSTLIAGVTWSLPFEWLFYLSLPLMATLMRRPTPAWLTWTSLALTTALIALLRRGILLEAFMLGGIAAWLVRRPTFKQLAQGPWASLTIVIALILTIATSHTAFATKALIPLAVAFALIAGGNTLFGALSSPLSRKLGDLSYGIYLLHGLLLFVTWHTVVGTARAARFSAAEHWGILTALTPVVVGVSALAFAWIERPALTKTDQITTWLKHQGSQLVTLGRARLNNIR